MIPLGELRLEGRRSAGSSSTAWQEGPERLYTSQDLSLWQPEALSRLPFSSHPSSISRASPTMNLLLFLLLLCNYAIPTTSQSDTPFASPTPSACSSASPSPSESHSPSESPSVTETQPGHLDSPSPSVTATQELIPAAEAPSFSVGPSLTSSFTFILTSSVSPSDSVTSSFSPSVSVTQAFVAVPTSSPNPTLSPSPSGTQSQSSSPTLSPSSSGSPEGSATGVGSPTPSPTFVPSPPATPSLNSTFSRSGASTRTTTPSLTLSRSPPRTLTVSTTQSRSRTVRATLTSSSTSTISATSASTPTASATVSSTSSASTTASQSSTGTTTGTDTATASSSPTPTPTLAPPTLFSASQVGPGAPLVITGQYLASQGGIDALEVQSSDGSVSFPPLSPPPCLYLPPPLTTFAIVCTLPPSIYGPSLSVRVRVRGIFTGWLVGVAATFAPRVHSVTTVVGGSGGGGGGGGGSTVVLYPLSSSSSSFSSFSLPLEGGTLMQVTGWGLHPVGNVSLTLSGSPPLPVPLLSGTSSSLPFPVAAALASVAEDPLYPTLTNVSLLSTLNAALSARYTAWVPTAMDSVLCVTPPWTSPWAGGVATLVVSLTPTQQTTNFTLVFALQPPRTRPSELAFGGGSSPSSSLGLWPTIGDGLVVNPGGGGDGGVSVTGSVSVVGSGLGELGGTVLVGGGGGGYECPMLWGTTLSVLGVTRGAFEALLRVAGGDTPTSPTTSSFCPGMTSVGATLGVLSSDTVLAATAPYPLSTDVSCGSFSLICVGTQYTSTTPTLFTPLPPGTTVLCITTPSLPTQQSFTPTDLGFLNDLVYNATLAPVYLTPIVGGGAFPLATSGPPPLTQSLTFPRHWQEAPSAPGSSGSGIPCAVLSWLGSTSGTTSSSSSSFSTPQRGTVVFTRPPLRGSSCVALARDGNASLTSAQCLPVSYGAPAWRVGGGSGVMSGVGGSLGPPLSPTSGSPLGGSVVTLAGSSLGIAPSLCAIWQASGAPGLLVGSPTCLFPPFTFTVLFLTQQQGSTSPPAPPLACSPILSWGDSSVTCVSPMGVPGSLANVSIVYTQAAASAAAAVAASATTADAITSPIPFAYSPSILLALATSPSLPVPPTGGFNVTVTGVNLLPPTPGWSAVVMLGAGVSPRTGQIIGSVGGGVSPTFDLCAPTFTPSASSSSSTSTAFTCNIPSSSSSSSPLSLLPTKSQQGASSTTTSGTSILEGNATLSLVYYSGSRGGSGSGAGGIGSNTLPIYATPPVNVVAREVLTTGNLSGCPSGTTSPPLPCFHVSGLSPTSPLFLTITGAFLGPLVGDLRITLTPTPLATGGQYVSPFPRVTLSPTATLPSPLPGAVNCTNPLLYSSSLITCAVVSPLPTGYLTLTIEGLAYAVIQIPALGACSPNWYVSSPTTPTASGGGGMCAQCPSGATCPGGLSPALALPGYWATPTTSTSTSTSSAFSPCPVPQLCVGEGVCAFGTTGDFCAQCLGARVLVVGRGCVECSGGWEVSLGNVYGGALGALGGVVVCMGVWWWVERERGGGHSHALPLTPLLTIAVSPLHLLIILAPFLHSVQNAQGYLESTPEVDFFLRVLAFVAAAVRDLGSSTPAVLCWFKGWSQGYRVVAVAAFPLLVCAAIWVGMFVAWGVMRVVKRGEVAREEAQRQLAQQQQAAALVQRFPLPLPVEEEQEQPSASSSSSSGGVEGGGDPVVEVEGRSSSSSTTNTDNPVFGIPGTVGSLLAMFNTRVKLLESELATRDSLLQSALKAAGEAKARQMEQANHSREVAAMARLQQLAAATVPQTPLPPQQALPKDLYGRWKLSVQCRLAYYCCILALILLLPQTLAYSFAWTQCTPPSLGGYSIEDPSLSCASEGWRSWGVPLLVTPLYLLLPLACFPLLLFVGGAGGGGGVQWQPLVLPVPPPPPHPPSPPW